MKDLAVVVPAYNERDWIGPLLTALAAQTDQDFTVVVVDNASTDDTASLVLGFPGLDLVLIRESRPGAGTAADSGFRYAIANGARLLARTDADCVPAPDWVSVARARLAAGSELVCGRSKLREDEHPRWWERLYPGAVRLAALYGRWHHRARSHRLTPFARPGRRPVGGYRTPFVLVHGHNLAMTADLYERCGGTPREALADGVEDVTLLNRARRVSSRIERAEDLVVAASLRRLRAWGPRRTLLWHWDRRYRPAAVHVR